MSMGFSESSKHLTLTVTFLLLVAVVAGIVAFQPGSNPQSPQQSVVLVKPTFTLTPYAGHSFYAFYNLWGPYGPSGGRITGGLNLLQTHVPANLSWGPEQRLYDMLRQDSGLVVNESLFFTDDQSVMRGGLFNPDGSLKYQVVVLGHEEYVTQAEYYQFWHFVAAGGRLVEMSGNIFYALVDYNFTTNVESLVVGHGFAFNGDYATRNSIMPFYVNNSRWFASNYLTTAKVTNVVLNMSNTIASRLPRSFLANYSGYDDELNAITNSTLTSVIAEIHNDATTDSPSIVPLISSYVHAYGKGLVICLCADNRPAPKQEAYGDPGVSEFLAAAITTYLCGERLFGNSFTSQSCKTSFESPSG